MKSNELGLLALKRAAREDPGQTLPTTQARAELAVEAPEARAKRRALLRLVRLPLLLILLVVFVTLGALYAAIPPFTDQEQLGYMGYVALHGGVLYRDAGDTNMPGEPLLHAAALAAFGNHYWSYGLLDYLLLLVFVGAMGRLLSEAHGILAGVLFSLIYPGIYVTAGFGMAGQRDFLAAHAVTIAAFLFLRRLDGRGLVWPILAGSLIGLAVLLKPTFGVVYPLLLAYDLYRVRSLRRSIADAAAVALGMALVISPLVAIAAVTGALKPWCEMTILYSLRYYAADKQYAYVAARLFKYARSCWHWYIVVAICGAAIWSFSRRRDTLVATLIVGATVAASALAQRKGYEYHIAGEMVVLALLDVYFLMEVVRYGLFISDRRVRILLMMLPLSLFGLGLASKCVGTFQSSALWLAGAIDEEEFLRGYGFDDVVATARYVARTTKPGQTVWPWTRHMMICTLADRMAPTRFSTAMFLRMPTPSPLANAWRDEVRLTLEQRPPELIILQRDTPDQEIDWRAWHVGDYEPLRPLLTALEQRFRHERSIGRFELFRLTSAATKGSAGPPGPVTASPRAAAPASLPDNGP
jgi:hypothetical protein